MKHILFLTTAFLSLTACESSLGGNARIVELYDAADPAGGLEIEMARDGSLREIEVQIPIADLPSAVVDAANAAAPGGQITAAEREINVGGEFWEVAVRAGGAERQFVIDAGGNVLETESAIVASEGPDGLVDAARREVPEGAVLQSIERVTFHADDVDEYHVKFEHAGASYKVVLDEAAAVKRAVREQRAEIEIPLR